LPTTLVDSRGTMRPMLRLALPVLAEQLLAMMVGFSDTLLAGHYFDAPELAAINLMSYSIWLVQSLFTVVAVGATALVARCVGAGDMETARRTTNQALLVGGLLAVPMTLASPQLAEALVGVMQLPPDSSTLAVRYLVFLFSVLPAVMITSVGNACLRGAGDTVTGLVVMTVVNLVNVGLSWSLVLGWGPLPTLGWDALAWGTCAGYVVGGLSILGALLCGRAGLGLSIRQMKPDPALIRRLLRVGIPAALDMAALLGCQFWFVAIINELGAVAAAAHGIAIRIESIAYLPGNAFQVAAGTLAGQYLGAGDPRRATRSVLMACGFGGGLMVSAGILFFLEADPLVAAFLRNDQLRVAQQTAPLLRIVAFAMPALALTMILSGALRGAGDTRWPLVITLVGFLALRIPAAYWLMYGWGWGLKGAWYAMVADLWLRCLFVLARFGHGGWRKTVV